MSYASNIKATQLSSSGQISAAGVPCHVNSIWVNAGTSAGTITLNNGGSSGTSLGVWNVPAVSANANGGMTITLPEKGIYFNKDCYCTISNVSFVTITFY